MMFQRSLSAAAVVAAALLLSGCFVVSKNVPAGKAASDERLVGAWVGVDDEGDTPADTAFLHFQLQDDATEPLRLVWVEGKNYQVYELITLDIAGKNVFAAKLVAPREAKNDKDMQAGYFIGFYEVNGDEAVFHMLDSQKVGETIGRGVVKGIKPPGKYDYATLTGSPAELARVLASPEADAGRGEDPARLRRLHPSVKK